MKLLQYVIYPLVVCCILFLLFAFVQGSFDPMGWDKRVRVILSCYWAVACLFIPFMIALHEAV